SPPDGVRVISVARTAPEAAGARENAAREAARRAETQALEERVRQLESAASAAAPGHLPDDPGGAPDAILERARAHLGAVRQHRSIAGVQPNVRSRMA